MYFYLILLTFINYKFQLNNTNLLIFSKYLFTLIMINGNYDKFSIIQ